MRARWFAAALAVAALPPAFAQADAEGLLVGSIALAPPMENIGRITLYLRPLGDPSHELGISFVNGGVGSDPADVQSAGEKAWVFTQKLAPGRYEVVRMQTCPATTVRNILLPTPPAFRRSRCSDIEGDRPVLLEVKPGATVYAGRWHLAAQAQQPPEPKLAWKPPQAYLRDAYAEDVPLLAGKTAGNASAPAVENPIAVLLGAATK